MAIGLKCEGLKANRVAIKLALKPPDYFEFAPTAAGMKPPSGDFAHKTEIRKLLGQDTNFFWQQVRLTPIGSIIFFCTHLELSIGAIFFGQHAPRAPIGCEIFCGNARLKALWRNF